METQENELIRPSWHSWGNFATGGAEYGRKVPGPDNIIFKNNSYDHKGKESLYSDSTVIYSFEGYGVPKIQNWQLPQCLSFYTITCDDQVTPNYKSKNKLNIQSIDNLNLHKGRNIKGQKVRKF